MTAEIAPPRPGNLSRIVENEKDVVGLVALGHLVLVAMQREGTQQLLQKELVVSQHEIDLYREASLKSLDTHGKRMDSDALDRERQRIMDSAYQELTKSNLDFVIAEQRHNNQAFLAELKRSGGVARQIIIAIFAALAFGCVITASRYFIDNPLQPLVDVVVKKFKESK